MINAYKISNSNKNIAYCLAVDTDEVAEIAIENGFIRNLSKLKVELITVDELLVYDYKKKILEHISNKTTGMLQLRIVNFVGTWWDIFPRRNCA